MFYIQVDQAANQARDYGALMKMNEVIPDGRLTNFAKSVGVVKYYVDISLGASVRSGSSEHKFKH